MAKGPKPPTNTMQFVKVGPAKLHEEARKQMVVADAVKEMRRKVSYDQEDWQSNLDSWKTCRRKKSETIIERVSEVKKFENWDNSADKAPKTFSQMMADRSDRGHSYNLSFYNTEDDKTKPVDGEKILEEQEDKGQDDEEECDTVDSTGQNQYEDVKNGVGNGDSEEYTFEKAIEGYKQYAESRNKNNVEPRRDSVKVNEYLAALNSAVEPGRPNPSGEIRDNGVDVGRRRSMFESSSNQANKQHNIRPQRKSEAILHKIASLQSSNKDSDSDNHAETFQNGTTTESQQSGLVEIDFSALNNEEPEIVKVNRVPPSVNASDNLDKLLYENKTSPPTNTAVTGMQPERKNNVFEDSLYSNNKEYWEELENPATVTEALERQILSQLENGQSWNQPQSLDVALAPPSTVEPPREKPPPPPIDTEPESFTGMSLDNIEDLKQKRLESTKRLKKQINRKRSDFLGIDVEDGTSDDADKLVAPPPNMESLLRAERELEDRHRRQLVEEQKTRDLEVQARQKEMESSPTPSEEELLREERAIIESLEREEMERESLHYNNTDMEQDRIQQLEMERLQMSSSRGRNEYEEPVYCNLPQRPTNLPVQDFYVSPHHTADRKFSLDETRSKPEFPIKAQPITRQELNNGVPKPSLVDEQPWLARRKSDVAKPNYNKHWLVQEAEQRRITEQQERESFKPLYNNSVPRPFSNPTVKPVYSPVEPQPGYQTTIPNYSYSTAQPQTPGKYQQSVSPQLSPALYPQPYRSPSENVVYRSNPPSYAQPYQNSDYSRTPDYSNYQTTDNNYSKTQALPDEVIQTLTKRVQSRQSNPSTPTPTTPVPTSVDRQPLYENMQQMRGTPQNPTKFTAEEPQILSVSGKKKCSHCGDELGRGAAMIIESLRLFYHLTCFRCCVCNSPLGNGTSGADVRVRNNRLHCHNCYSNDEGLKFSKV